QARTVDPGDGPWTGAKRPKVTIVEWSDFQCPYCARVVPTLKQILETYKDDVRLVWRNEPLGFHPNAMPAAKAAMAAYKQGNHKFWNRHARMVPHQHELKEAQYAHWQQDASVNLAQATKDT